MATNIGHRISVDHRVRRALLRPAFGASANFDCRVLVDDNRLVGQRLRVRRIEIVFDLAQ